MFFIKFILDDEQQSMAAKILKLQTEQPTNGDQASMCRNDLKQMKRNQKNDKRKFQSNHQTKYWYFCLKYILKKINPKGKEFLYDRLEIQMIWIIECHKTKFRYHYFYLYTRLLVQILLQYLIFWQLVPRMNQKSGNQEVHTQSRIACSSSEENPERERLSFLRLSSSVVMFPRHDSAAGV